MDTLFSLDTTIFAWATAIDGAARAILRVSGPRTFDVLGRFFLPDTSLPPRHTVSGVLVLPDDLKVRVWVWTFPGPGSYTGQDMAETHTIRAPPLQKLIDQDRLRRGLIPARPGEFSARAFLLGKMDLTQAQAVNALIEAENDAQIRASLDLLHGRLHQRLTDLYHRLANLATALEANIDFSEEDIEVIALDQVLIDVDRLNATVAEILKDAIDVRALRDVPRVFLAGPANAGKSTLLNRLTGLDRAICSPLPGTTRDILTALWSHQDRQVLLCDTPGLIAITDDPFTRAAVERTRRVLAFADLVLLVLHAARKSADQLQLAAELGVHRGKLLIVLNKTDITIAEELSGRVAELKHHADHWETEIFPISAAKGTGLPALTAAVFDRLGGLPVSAAAGRIALDLRGRQCLDAVRDALDQARIDVQTLRTRGTAGHLGLETVAADIQTALRALGPLLGKDVTEDVFENIFANFCIGK